MSSRLDDTKAKLLKMEECLPEGDKKDLVVSMQTFLTSDSNSKRFKRNLYKIIPPFNAALTLLDPWLGLFVQAVLFSVLCYWVC